jgi:hypothetical protein
MKYEREKEKKGKMRVYTRDARSDRDEIFMCEQEYSGVSYFILHTSYVVVEV